MSVLDIKDLQVSINEKNILKGLNLEIKSGEIHAVMGPNGAGKSTLASAIMGHPKYEVDGGSILLDGEEVLEMEVDERARAGLFLAMQYPSEVPGVPTSELIKSAINAQRDENMPLMKYIKKLDQTMEFLEMDLKMSQRYVNDGFSGGEKKRNEILQMMMIEPKFAILDEIDSGLDIDALKVIGRDQDIKFTSLITKLHNEMIKCAKNSKSEEEYLILLNNCLSNIGWWNNEFCNKNRCKFKENIINRSFI